MSEWSPYGLERYRVGSSGGKNKWLLALLALLILGWLALNLLGNEATVSVGVGGKEGQVALTGPEDPGPTKTTVTIQPGKVAAVDAGTSAQESSSTAVGTTAEKPFPILGWILLYGPFLLLPWLARRLLARPSKKELNFGVYKGAMPLEMISASQRDMLYSRKAVESPLFGKSREDYVEDG